MRLRVLSYNIHKCIGRDRKYQPQRIAETIAHYAPDIVLLQEVDEGAVRSRHERQVDVLGDLLGMEHRAFACNVTLRSGGGYGNAVLSRWPIATSANVDLTVPLKKRRSVLYAALHLPQHRALHVFNAHLGLAQYERKQQLVKILNTAEMRELEGPVPVICGGDFNDVYGNLRVQLIPAGFVTVAKPPRSFPSGLPLRALDSIYVRGRAELAAFARGDTELAKIASDHRPVYADVDLL